MAGITGISGDGIARTFVRDTTNTAVIGIRVNCAGSFEKGPKVSNTHAVDGVRVELGGRVVVAEPPPSRDELGSGTYVAHVPVGSVAGNLAGRAVIDGTWTNVNVMGESTTVPWDPAEAFVVHIAVDGDPPQLNVAVPDQTEAEARLPLTVTASDPGSGLKSTTWEIPGYQARPLQADSSVIVPFDWRDVTKAKRSQPCPVEVRVLVRARDNAQPNGNEAVREIILHDRVAPLVTIVSPQDGQKIPNDGAGATIQLQGTAEDYWSGVAAIEYALDDGLWLKLAPDPGGATSVPWRVSHRIAAYGTHKFAFRATDVADNVLNLIRTVEIAAPLLIETSDQPLSPTAYLSDLLDFAGRSANLPRNEAARITEAAERRLVEVELGRVFHQRPREIVEAGERVGAERLSRVRATIEVLLRILDPTNQDLVALWTFDEGAGPFIRDRSGNGFSARAPQGVTPHWVPGRGGLPLWLLGRVTPTALQFDGISDELLVDEPGALTMRDVLSVVAWVKPEGPGHGDYSVIFCKEGEYALGRSSDGFLAVEFANAYPGWTWLKTSIVLPEGEWCHVAVVYDAGQILSYKDGRLASRFGGSGPIGSTAPSVQDVRIGGRQSTDARFRGAIDELRLYRGALASSTIAHLSGTVPQLLAHWPLSVESSDTAIDAVSKRPLMLDGAGWGDGRTGRALSLASHQGARVDAVDGLQVGTDDGDFTVSAWLRLRGNPEALRRSVIRKGKSSNQHTFDIHLAAGTNALQVSVSTEANEAESLAKAIPLAQDQWIHIAYVKDGNRVVLYTDGSEAGVRTLSGRTVFERRPDLRRSLDERNRLQRSR